MNRIFRFLMATVCIAPLFSAGAAVQVKKAAPVVTKPSGGTDGAASLVPTVIGLVSGVIDMNAKQKALTSDCIPTTAEMNFVDNTMKEWAKTGQVTANSLKTVLRREPCASANGYSVEVGAMAAPGLTVCYNSFKSSSDEGMIWYNFPKTGKGTYCKNGALTCTGNDLVTVSDTYDIFNLIDFGPADYTPSEATMAAKLLKRVESCSTSKLNAKKKQMWGEFLINTAGSLGQKTNTGGIMQQVGAISSSGGVSGALGSFNSIATQLMAK